MQTLLWDGVPTMPEVLGKGGRGAKTGLRPMGPLGSQGYGDQYAPRTPAFSFGIATPPGASSPAAVERPSVGSPSTIQFSADEGQKGLRDMIQTLMKEREQRELEFRRMRADDRNEMKEMVTTMLSDMERRLGGRAPERGQEDQGKGGGWNTPAEDPPGCGAERREAFSGTLRWSGNGRSSHWGKTGWGSAGYWSGWSGARGLE